MSLKQMYVGALDTIHQVTQDAVKARALLAEAKAIHSMPGGIEKMKRIDQWFKDVDEFLKPVDNK